MPIGPYTFACLRAYREHPPAAMSCLGSLAGAPGPGDSKPRINAEPLEARSTWGGILIENGPFIVDVPIKVVIFHSYVSLPEGNPIFRLS